MLPDRAATTAKRLIADMRARRPGEAQHHRFLHLCKIVSEAYSGADLSAVRAHPITPTLAAFVALAFAEYVEQEPNCRTTEDRAGAIASALRMTTRNRRGTVVRRLPEDVEFRVYTSFAFEYHGARQAGAPAHLAYERGITAAYRALRHDADGDQSGTQRKKTKEILRELIAAHGHPEPDEAKARREGATLRRR